MKRILYSGTRNASSWALRAWLALREAGVPFEEIVVDIRVPQRFDNLAAIAKFSPPGAVPVLVEDDIVIYDSLAIMEYANELADGKLLPPGIRARAHCRSLLGWQHSGLSNLCPRLSFEASFYADKRAMTPEEQRGAARVFGVWEQELADSGGPFLTGRLSLADLAFVPTIQRLTTHMPSLAAWPRASRWVERMLARESVSGWLAEACALPEVRLDDYQPAGRIVSGSGPALTLST